MRKIEINKINILTITRINLTKELIRHSQQSPKRICVRNTIIPQNVIVEKIYKTPEVGTAKKKYEK